MTGLFLCYIPIHDVAPSAVTIAVATDAMICTMNFIVSRLVMVLIFKFYQFSNFYIVQRVGAVPLALCALIALAWVIAAIVAATALIAAI
jgi:hypothetical protein